MTGALSQTSLRPRAVLLALAVLPIVLLVFAPQAGWGRLVVLAAAGCAAVAAGCAVLVRPILGVYAIVFYVFAGAGQLLHLPLAAPLVALLFVAALLDLVRGADARLRDDPFWWGVGLFIALGIQSMLVAHRIDISLLRLAAYLKALVLVFVTVQFVRSAEQLRTLTRVVFAAGVATILLGVVSHALGRGTEVVTAGPIGMIRFSGLHRDPNEAAAYLCAALPFGILALRDARRAWLRLACALGVVLLVVGVFATFSRAAVFTLALVAAGAMAREVRGRRGWLAVLVLLAVGVLLGPRYYFERVFALGDVVSNVNRDWSVLMRMRALETAWELFTQHPLTGVGMGNFIVRGDYNLWIRIVVHNSYMEVLVGMGIFGLAAFLTMLGAALRHPAAGARERWPGREWMRPLCYYVVVSMGSAMASALFLSTSYRYLLWIPVAAALIVGGLRREARGAHAISR
ncbi:MAG: O-antigen ligase family protein [Candidatus Krumholzibacteria bacterium]|nr:O-antigen ligase family protein [Candidatus Krumholzibacteria bacterium]